MNLTRFAFLALVAALVASTAGCGGPETGYGLLVSPHMQSINARNRAAQQQYEQERPAREAAQEEQIRRSLRVQECMQKGGDADACYDQFMKDADTP